VTKELEENEEETDTVTEQIDNLNKHVVEVINKEETHEKTITNITTTTTTNTVEVNSIKRQKRTLLRRRNRQKCSRMFPSIFNKFKIEKELKDESMCPCPGSGRGKSQLVLNNIDDVEDFNYLVQGLFEKNLAIESAFFEQSQRYYTN